jgi:hypothetical protein
MADDEPHELIIPPARSDVAPVNDRSASIRSAMEAVGFADQDIVATLVDIARTGRRRVTRYDGAGNVTTTEIIEDPKVQLEAIDRLINLSEGETRKPTITIYK